MGNNQHNEGPLGIKGLLDYLTAEMSRDSGPSLLNYPTENGTAVRLEFTDKGGTQQTVIGLRNQGFWEFTGVPLRFIAIEDFVKLIAESWEYDRMFLYEEAGTVDPNSEAENAPETDEQPEPCTCLTCEMRRALWGRN